MDSANPWRHVKRTLWLMQYDGVFGKAACISRRTVYLRLILALQSIDDGSAANRCWRAEAAALVWCG